MSVDLRIQLLNPDVSLDYVYTGGILGENLSLDLLMELLVLSNYYHVINLFDEIQGEIITRRLLRPDTVDKSESMQFVWTLSLMTV